MHILVVFPSGLEAKNFEVDSKHTVEVLVSGVGGFATMYSLSKYCALQKPDYIIHAGICGTFDETLAIGDVVDVMIDHFADFGVMENGQWKTGFDLKLVSGHKKPFSDGQLVAPNNDFADVPKVVAVTSQTITTTAEQKKRLLNTFHPSIETMEGAFVHYVCLQEDIPFVHLRAVSNVVGERDKSKWNTKLAIENLHNEIINVILSID
ncbi:MAG: futalosine hydrolase [Bacteroidales bacterium]|nr:futalosine hydrolase [Bacteroidales bacterium]